VLGQVEVLHSVKINKVVCFRGHPQKKKEPAKKHQMNQTIVKWLKICGNNRRSSNIEEKYNQ
jgi:uncharacterized protein YqiB (DUF1249 family)